MPYMVKIAQLMIRCIFNSYVGQFAYLGIFVAGMLHDPLWQRRGS